MIVEENVQGVCDVTAIERESIRPGDSAVERPLCRIVVGS